MAVADYYERAALAAAHALGQGFEETRFKELLERTPFGLALDESAASAEGQTIAEMTIRLTARLYPTLSIIASSLAQVQAQRLEALARDDRGTHASSNPVRT